MVGILLAGIREGRFPAARLKLLLRELASPAIRSGGRALTPWIPGERIEKSAIKVPLQIPAVFLGRTFRHAGFSKQNGSSYVVAALFAWVALGAPMTSCCREFGLGIMRRRWRPRLATDQGWARGGDGLWDATPAAARLPPLASAWHGPLPRGILGYLAVKACEANSLSNPRIGEAEWMRSKCRRCVRAAWYAASLRIYSAIPSSISMA
jgi:hypothetical protein